MKKLNKLSLQKTAITRIQSILLIAIIVIAAGAAGGYYFLTLPEEKPTIVLATSGGNMELAFRKAVEMFQEENDVTVEYYIYTGSATALAKIRAEKDMPTIDVFMASHSTGYSAAIEDLVIPVPTDKISNLQYLPSGAIPKWTTGPNAGEVYGVPLYGSTIGIAVNTERVTEDITSYRYLWDNSLEPDKLMLPAVHQFNGLLGLMIPNLLYGGTWTNLDPGFEALKTMAPNIGQLWSGTADAVRAMTAGEVDAVLLVGQIAYGAYKEGAPIKFYVPHDDPEIPLFAWVGPIQAVKDGPTFRKGNDDIVWKFIDHMAEANVQTEFSKISGKMMMNKNAETLPELEPWSYSAADRQNLVVPDIHSLATNLDAWIDQWELEIVPLIG